MKRTFRQMRLCCFAAAALSSGCLVCTDAAIAQLQTIVTQAGCSGDGATCPSTVAAVAMGDLEVVKNQPYQAKAITETKQTLSDGSHTDQTTTAAVTRDSNGRTASTQTLGNGTTFTTIFDPVAGTHIDYASNTKVAHVMTLPTTLPPGSGAAVGSGFSGFVSAPASSEARGVFVLGHAFTSQGDAGTKPATESLGTKTIEGLEAVGTRSTSTIPVGSIGNDKNIVISQETWYSPDFKLILQSTMDDPRFGQTTYSLTSIERGEPDPSLFQVPAGYKVDKVSVPAPPQ